MTEPEFVQVTRASYDADQVAAELSRAGLEVRARVLREPDDGGAFPEQTPQAFLLARRPARTGGRS